MVGESCRESLGLNYTDGEHQIQEKLPRLWGERWGRERERGEEISERFVRGKDVCYGEAISISSSTLDRPRTHRRARSKVAPQII